MNGSEPIYYLDTCVFLAWLKDEKRPPGETDGAKSVMSQNKRGENIIITSTITIVEILQSKIDEEKEKKFIAAMMRPENSFVAVDIAIAKRASEIRNYYLENNLYEGKTISTPDAIHLATAIILGTTEFHTFDDKDRENSIGLIQLSGDKALNGLIIRRPSSDQKELDLKDE